MFDILVYLFETYAQPGAFPERKELARKLSAAGFEQDDIAAALEWLSGLEHLGESGLCDASGVSAHRVYCAIEEKKLPIECRSFLYFLENAGAIDGVLREMIVHSAMALHEAAVSLDKLKIIVLMVLWRRHEPVDMLLLEELLCAEDETPSFTH